MDQAIAEGHWSRPGLGRIDRIRRDCTPAIERVYGFRRRFVITIAIAITITITITIAVTVSIAVILADFVITKVLVVGAAHHGEREEECRKTERFRKARGFHEDDMHIAWIQKIRQAQQMRSKASRRATISSSSWPHHIRVMINEPMKCRIFVHDSGFGRRNVSIELQSVIRTSFREAIPK